MKMSLYESKSHHRLLKEVIMIGIRTIFKKYSI